MPSIEVEVSLEEVWDCSSKREQKKFLKTLDVESLPNYRNYSTKINKLVNQYYLDNFSFDIDEFCEYMRKNT